MTDTDRSDPGDDLDLEIQLEAIAEQYLDQIQKGRTPDREALVAAHPDLADVLDKHLKLIDAMHRARVPEQPQEDGDVEPGTDPPPLLSILSPGPSSHPTEIPGRVGPYRILETLGVGGMGEVYLAEQEEPIHRKVALKLIKLGMDTREVVARFETERQALALMNHPHIAKVHDAGAAESGRPYFVMEYVEGDAITDFCDRERLGLMDRLGLFVGVCEAVQHAHQKGVIHRDLKPSNILVSRTNGTYTPKIIDFGVAKATDQRLAERTAFTEQGRVIGTPEYMSPEQAETDGADVDTRTDIYSLGVILYELLVGALPLDARALRDLPYDEIRRRIREEAHSKPSTRLSTLKEDGTAAARRRQTDVRSLARLLRGDLDWITMKALAKEPDRRYATASEFAADILRHRDNEPVLARPPGVGYRMAKFFRRHRVPVLSGGFLAAGLLAGFIFSLQMYFRAEGERERAERAWQAESDQREEAERQREAAELASAQRAAEARKAVAVKDFLVDMLSAALPENQGRDVKLADVVKAAEASILGELDDEPEIQAALLDSTGATYHALGMYPDAVRHRRAALEIRERVLGPDHQETLESAVALGVSLRDMDRWGDSAEILRRSLDRLRKTQGPSHEATLYAQSHLASVLRKMLKYEEAERLARDAADRYEAMGDARALLPMGVLASVLHATGRLSEGKELQEKVVEGTCALYGEEDRHTLTAMNTLALILEETGDFDEAGRVHRRLVDVSKRLMGPDHPYTISALLNLGDVLARTGAMDDAEAHYRRALKAADSTLGEEHGLPVLIRHNLASLLSDRQEYDEAERLFREVIRWLRLHRGDEHPNTFSALNNLGAMLGEMGRVDEAVSVYSAALAGHRRSGRPDNPKVLMTQVNLATNLRKQGKLDEAERLLRRSIDGLSATLGQRHIETLNARNGLCLLLQARGDRVGAIEEWRKIVAEARESAHPGSWRAALFPRNLATALLDQGECGEAEKFALQAREAMEAIFGPDHPRTTEILWILVKIYESSEQDQKARECRATLEKLGSPDPPR